MNLDFFKERKNNLEKSEVKDFLDELADCINNFKEKMLKQKDIREEGLYYVLDGNPDKVYLTKFNSKKVFEANDLPKEIRNTVSEGFVLRYRNGEYTVDEELTEKNFDGLLNIDEYKEWRIKNRKIDYFSY